MLIHRASLDTCGNEKDTVIVIDVLRAFTTAAYAFSRGAREIILASTIEHAYELKERYPDALLVGELRGYPIDRFDYGNSPSGLASLDLTGRRLVHRTTAGTQGAIRSKGARHILATGFATASATIQKALSFSPASITLVQTELLPNGNGDEDVACADLIETTLRGEPVDLKSLKQRVRNSVSGLKFTGPPGSIFPAADLEAALQVDIFDFAMIAETLDNELVLRRTEVN
jgi:2-phosphosulfolactate phosphatase